MPPHYYPKCLPPHFSSVHELVFVIRAYNGYLSNFFLRSSNSYFAKSPSPPHGFLKIRFIFSFFTINMLPQVRLKILVFWSFFQCWTILKIQTPRMIFLLKHSHYPECSHALKSACLLFFSFVWKKPNYNAHDFLWFFYHPKC